MAYEDYGYGDYSPDVFASTPFKEEKQKKSWLDTLGGVVDVIGKGIDSYIKVKPTQETTLTQPIGPIFEPKPSKKGSGGLIVASVVGVAAIVGLVFFLKNKKS